MNLDPLLQFIHQHQQWAWLFAFLISFAETLVIIGSFIPGSVLMTAIGGLMGLGSIPVASTLIASIIGAIIGDGVSYTIGYCYHQHLRNMWPLRSMPTWLARAEAFFAAHGGKSIAFGRFIGPLRAFIPVIAGMMQLSPRTYLIASISSAIIWAPAYLLPGYLIGHASKSLPPHLALTWLAYLLLAVLGIWVLGHALHRLHHLTIQQYRTQLRRWQKSSHWPKWLDILCHDARMPISTRQFSTLLFVVFLTIILIALSVLVHRDQHPLLAINPQFWHFFRSLRNPALDHIMLLITYAGEKKVLVCSWAALLFFALYRRAFHFATQWLCLFVSTLSGAWILKNWIAHPRPPGLILTPEGFSFPSGHVVLSSALLGFLLFATTEKTREEIKQLIYFALFLFVGIIALSRLYLGVHWFLDTLAGLCWGSICAASALIALRRAPMATDFPAHQIWLVTLSSFALSYGVYAFLHYRPDQKNLLPEMQLHHMSEDQWWSGYLDHHPFYRTSRLGHIHGILNLQWYGDKKNIITQLEQHGFTLLIKPKWPQALNPHRSQGPMNAFRHQLYLDKVPAWVMTQHLSSGWLTLRFWDSHVRINAHPLWVGDVQLTNQKSHRALKQLKTLLTHVPQKSITLCYHKPLYSALSPWSPTHLQFPSCPYSIDGLLLKT